MSSPTPTDHQQELTTRSTSYAGETMNRNSEDFPSSSSSDSDNTYDIQQATSPTSPFQQVEQEQECQQQLVNPSASDTGKTTTQDSDLPTLSSDNANVNNGSTLSFQQQQQQELMKIAQSAYSRKHDAYVIPPLPSLEGFPSIPQFTFSKSTMEKMLANVLLPPSPPISKMKPVSLQQQSDNNKVPANSPTIITRPSSSSSLKIRGDSDNIKNPPLPPITYLRQRSRPPKASSDDRNFKIPPQPSSRRALDNNEAGTSGGDGDESGDTMLKEVLDSPCSKQKFDSTVRGSMTTPNDDGNECSTSDMDESES